jgi:hypothetical protein
MTDGKDHVSRKSAVMLQALLLQRGAEAQRCAGLPLLGLLGLPPRHQPFARATPPYQDALGLAWRSNVPGSTL